jgi:2-methylisocitrate lyase-like PEP mutase family enzyme
MRPSQKLRQLFKKNTLYFAPGVYNGLSAKLVDQAGFEIVYASGGAIARSIGLPDMELISFDHIIERLREIVLATDKPVIADADNGYGNALTTWHVMKKFEHAGVAAIHLEDQALPKRCGHYEGKTLVSTSEQLQKIKAAKDACPDLYLIARTDAIAVEGINSAIDRAHQYIDAGAEMIFVEAPTTTDQIQEIAKQLPYPKLLNMFDSGKTPIVPPQQLKDWGYTLVIDPSDLQRASIKAMQNTLAVLKKDGNSHAIKDQLVSFREREALIGTEHYMRLSEHFSH